MAALTAAVCASARAPYAGMSARQSYLYIAEKFSPEADMPVAELTAAIALHLQDTPYLAGMLDEGPEALVVRYDATDCMLFVETCIATALSIKGIAITEGGLKRAEPSFGLMLDNVRMLRYEGGVVDYLSREHYASAWLANAGKLGVAREYSCSVGIPLDQKFSFMSTHPDSYRQLREDPSLLAGIRSVEARLSSKDYYWVPSARIASVEPSMRTGDIVCFVSKVKGLDTSHMAIACESEGRMCFIHASSALGKVVLDKRTVSEYATSGIRLSRLDNSADLLYLQSK